MATTNNRLGRRWETVSLRTPTRTDVIADIRFDTNTALWHGYVERPHLSEIHVSSKLYEDVLDQLQQKVPEQYQPVYQPYLHVAVRGERIREHVDPRLVGSSVLQLDYLPLEFSQHFPRERGRFCRYEDGRVRLRHDRDESGKAPYAVQIELLVADTPENRARLNALAKEVANFQANLHEQLRALATDIDAAPAAEEQ